MKNRMFKSLTIISLAVLMFCAVESFAKDKKVKKEKTKTDKTKKEGKLEEQPIQLNKTVGDLTEVMAFTPIPVKGIGLVVGLAKTGSSECPPEIRNYLRQYITTRVGDRQLVNPDKMIDSTDTAVVVVEGSIPAGVVKGQAFDISVRALPNTQTTSLKGGRLYTTELKFISQMEDVAGASKTLAYAAGSVYIDSLAETKPDQRAGFVLGGGKSIQSTQIMLSILKPDFRMAAIIRSRVCERFGKNVAEASSDSIITLNLPDKFKDCKERFIELVKALYIGSTPASEEWYINALVDKLKTQDDKSKYETGLEAIGKSAISKIVPLLDVNDAQTKFAAARCLLNLGEYSGLGILRQYAQDGTSPLQIDAIKAIGDAALKSDGIAIMNRLIGDKKLEVRYTAYQYLQKADDSSIMQTLIGKDFYIDQVIQISPKTIWVSRKDEARIVLFGAPLDCKPDIFIESDDGTIIINALPEENKISIMRKHPITGELMGPLKTSFRLVDVIKTLGDEPAPEDEKQRVGLGVSYSEIVDLLRKMCKKKRR